MKKNLCAFVLLFVVSISSAQEIIKIEGKELFGDLKARQIGPALMSGRVSDIEGHPSNSRTIYIGTAGGGVWRSQDGGVIFNSIFDEHCQSIGAVAVDPNDPDNSLWVGTGEVWTRNSVSIGDGIYKTNDGGKNWQKMVSKRLKELVLLKFIRKTKTLFMLEQWEHCGEIMKIEVSLKQLMEERLGRKFCI